MPITANVTNEQITATVGETQIDVSVSGGVGPSGSSGTAATIAVGTVTTGAAGSQASVTNVGTSSAAVFDFSIPAGATGATGPQGATGATGPAGVVAATAPLTYDANTQTVALPTNADIVAASITVTDIILGTYSVIAAPAGFQIKTATNASTPYFAINTSGHVTTGEWRGTAVAVAYGGTGATDAGTARTNLGLGNSATLNTGTSAGTVAAGDHTHSQLHDRSHAITSTSDHTAGNWKVFYSNGSGQLVELALGSSGQYLTANGTSSAPTFTTPSSGGATNVWIPASAFIPRTTNGCGVDSRETSTNKTNWDELLFDAGADEFAQAAIVMPSNYDAGSITARFYWTASGATDGSDDVIFGIQARAFANDDALDTAFGTAQTVTDTVIATNDMHISSATSAVTAGGTPAANVPLLIQIYRDADAAGDTYGHDARLLGVEIIYTAA